MNTTQTEGTIVQEIEIHAPAERIFEALTRAERMKWWGAEGRFRVEEFESDLRPGGKWRMSGQGMGHPFLIYGEYREIVRPRVLSFTWLPSWYPDATESLVRWDLDEKHGVTTVRLTHSGLTSEAARNSHKGWPDILRWLKDWAER